MNTAFGCCGLLFAVGLWLTPIIALLPSAIHGDGRGLLWWFGQPAFRFAARASIEQAIFITVVGALLGWLPGILTGLASKGWRLPIQCLCILPILLPPFLWAIGWSYLGNRAPLSWQEVFDGRWGLFLTGLVVALPLVTLTTSAAVRLIRPAEMDVALLLRDPWRVRWRIARRLFPVALGTGAIAALLGAADAGGGQIMGRHGIAGEVLVSFASRQAIGEAAAKALCGLALLSPLAALSLWPIKRLSPLLGQPNPRTNVHPSLTTDWFLAIAFIIILVQTLALPLLGIVQPLSRDVTGRFLQEAFAIWNESLGATVVLGAVGGLVATLGGILVASALQTWPRFRSLGLCLCGFALVLPSSLRTLGWLALHLRVESGWLAAGLLGVQWMPLAALLLAPAVNAIPRSWRDLYQLTGASSWTWWRHALLPNLSPWCCLSILISGILVLTDVTSLILIQPPGFQPFTVHLFAVMDNSMEVIVASLCLVLLIVPAVASLALLGVNFWITRARRLHLT